MATRRRKKLRRKRGFQLLSPLRRLKQSKIKTPSPFKTFGQPTKQHQGTIQNNSVKSTTELTRSSLLTKARKLHKCIKKPNSRKAGIIKKTGTGSRAWKPWCTG